jgi:glutaconate CoA-transferase subunit A
VLSYDKGGFGIMTTKVMTTKEAVHDIVKDGQLVCFGGFTHGIAFAVGHEMIRQGKKHLTVCKETPDLMVDQLLAAGCVDKLMFSWAGNPGVGSLHAFRRAVEKEIPHKIDIEEYTHFITGARYLAGASGLPFIPVTTPVLTTDLSKHSDVFKTIDCPFTGKKICLVKAINPDLAIIHAQRADREGNTQMWGIVGSNREIAMASRQVIVSVEEIVDSEIVRRDPNRTIIPGFHVDAVIQEPWGAHPSYSQGYYDRDNQYYMDYERLTRTPEDHEKFLQEWVFGVSDRAEYLKHLGQERVGSLKTKSYLSDPVDYGYFGE